MEQPSLSLLWKWPGLQNSHVLNVHKVTIRLGCFGGLSEKPLSLRGNSKALLLVSEINHELKKMFAQSGIVRDYTKLTSKGKRRLVSIYDIAFVSLLSFYPQTRFHVCFSRLKIVNQCRWSSGNEYTQISCLYPLHFGVALGAAVKISKVKGLTENERVCMAWIAAKDMFSDIPSVEKALEDANLLLDCRAEMPSVSVKKSMTQSTINCLCYELVTSVVMS